MMSTRQIVVREAAFRLAQRNVVRVWQEGGDFLALLKADPDVSAALSATELEALFDLGYRTRQARGRHPHPPCVWRWMGQQGTYTPRT